MLFAAFLLQLVTADFTLYEPNIAPCADFTGKTNQLRLLGNSDDNLAGSFTVGSRTSQVFNVSLWIDFPATLQLNALSISIFTDMVEDFAAPGPQKNSQPCVQPPGPPPAPPGGGPGLTALQLAPPIAREAASPLSRILPGRNS